MVIEPTGTPGGTTMAEGLSAAHERDVEVPEKMSPGFSPLTPLLFLVHQVAAKSLTSPDVDLVGACAFCGWRS